MDNTNSIISFNVGGEIFTTSTSTLRKLPGSLLADLVEYHLDLDGAEFGVNHTSVQSPHRSASSSKQSSPFASPFKSKSTPTTPTHKEHEWVRRPRYANTWKYVHLLSSTVGRLKPTRQNRQNRPNYHNHQNHQDHLQHHKHHSSADNVGVGGPVPHVTSTHHETIKTATDRLSTPVLFIDRNPILMPYIMDAYRLGQLHLPRDMCSLLIRTELKFWGISEDIIR